MWPLIVFYLLLLPCVGLFIHSKQTAGGTAPLTIDLKAGSTVLITLAALILCASAPEALSLYGIFITAGLVLGLVGDIVICQPTTGGFLSGMVFFALGHLSYIFAFAGQSIHRLWAVPVFVVIYLPFLLLLVTLSRETPALRNMVAPVAVYGALIITMLSLAVTLAFSAPRGLIIPVGAVLFAVSDSLLAYQTFQKKPAENCITFLQHCCNTYHAPANKALEAFGLSCYFIGQSFFAISIYLLR